MMVVHFGVEQKPAIKVWIADLDNCTFVQKEDAPSVAVLLDGRELSRVNIMGTVVGNDNPLLIDDGTGIISVRSFDKPFRAELGSFVRVIGRLREHLGEKYVAGEIVKQIDGKWFEVRKLELPFSVRIADEKREAPDGRNVLTVVRSLDLGDGADFDAVVAKLGSSGEELIVRLLALGELFETRPGKLKVLE